MIHMSHTPIYDQLRDDQINAEVPATGTDAHRAGHPQHHHLLFNEPCGAPIFGRPTGAKANVGASSALSERGQRRAVGRVRSVETPSRADISGASASEHRPRGSTVAGPCPPGSPAVNTRQAQALWESWRVDHIDHGTGTPST